MNAIKVFDLIPKNGRKSFYGKAKVIETKDAYFLRSYKTIICGIDKKTNSIVRYSDRSTHTTCQHVKSFLKTLSDQISYDKFWNIPLSKRNFKVVVEL